MQTKKKRKKKGTMSALRWGFAISPYIKGKKCFDLIKSALTGQKPNFNQTINY